MAKKHSKQVTQIKQQLQFVVGESSLADELSLICDEDIDLSYYPLIVALRNLLNSKKVTSVTIRFTDLDLALTKRPQDGRE